MHLFLILPLALLVSFIYLTVMTAAVIYMQPDYFIKKRTTRPVKETHKWAWLIVKVFKNVIGLFLILAGIIMLVTPGQGLLTILIGLFFMDFLYGLSREAEARNFPCAQAGNPQIHELA